MPSSSSAVIETVLEQSARVLQTYAVDPGLVAEHANGERRITQGGYGDRQLFELVQNAADEIADEPGGRIHAVLTKTHLYCANEGNPVTPEGAETILRMSMSKKRGGQIGRFGVGVKSVLVVTDTPEFFSSTGSFGFNRAWSYEQIKAVPGVTARYGPEFDAPVLRMARPLDMQAERAADPVLDELLGWAVTVVRLPLLQGADERLGRDMHGTRGKEHGEPREEFPVGFQLFSPHVGKVVLEDRRPSPSVRRVLTAQRSGDLHTVVEERNDKAASTEKWRVFTVTHEPGPAARADAGELHDRIALDLSWGVPALVKDPDSGLHVSRGARGRGKFWSFFPTKYEMSLSGVLNGAWKTNEDRQNLLDSSPFNQEMIRRSAQLVVDSLPALAPAEDPAAYLPLLPGRVKEAISWADEFLTREIWAHAGRSPSLPDQDGVLRVPTTLRIPPRLDKDPRKAGRWLRMWHECPGRPTGWLHPSAEADVLRAGKVEHILGAAGHERAQVREWLEALVESGSPQASAAAIRIVADMIERESPLAEDARRARIVLTEEHGLVAPVPGRVFRRADQDGLRESTVYVVAELAQDPSLAHALNILGIREADAEGRFTSVLDQGFAHYTDADWLRFWELFRRAGVRRLAHKVVEQVPDPRSTLRVRTADHRFRPIHDCMLPGIVVDAGRDPSVAVDMDFHSDDTPFFAQVGLSDRPSSGVQPADGEGWYEEYRAAVHASYMRTLSDSAPRPSLNRIKTEGAPIGGPLHLFTSLSPESRARFLRALPDDAVVTNWTLQIGAQTSTRQAVISPIRWMLRKHGTVATSKGIRPLKEAVGPELSAYRDVLPVADITQEKARRLRLPSTVDEVPGDRWESLLDEVSRSEDDVFVGTTYVMLTRFGADFPEDSLTRCRVGDTWDTRPDDEITLAVGDVEYRALRAEQVPALLVPTVEDAELMAKEWGMLRYADVISRETREVPDGDPVPLVELFPALRQRLNTGNRNTLVQRCVELEEVVRTPTKGAQASPLDAVRQDGVVKVRTPLEPEPMLRLIDRELGLGLGPAGCRAVLEHQERMARDSELKAAQQAVRDADDVVTKIELLIGADALRAGLPEGLMEAELQANDGTEPSSRRIAQMAFNAHGDGVLQQHARDIQARFPNAPMSYGGSSAAIAFVSDLRLPITFAGSRTPAPPPFETVEGPRDFPSLHDYQEDLVRNISTMLDRLAPQRGMLSLPTGAGKTRVTAEAVIRWVKRVGDLKGPLLWIAQTEELCEQAVQSWKFVWSKVGAERPLTISRLWSSNEVGDVADHPHLVVATDAKLQKCLGTDQYAWLREASLVIVDEAHTAISPRYTEVLALLGLTQYETRRHLLGLTATPFRNTNEDETRRLIGRFGNRRLDEGVFPSGDPYSDLQKWGMLAQVEHRTLEGGRIELSQDEKTHAERMAMLSRAAEQRLADDHARSRRIVDSVAELPEDWPTLLFATSVDHAKYLAAMLNDRGVPSAAVDSTTSAQDRRTRVEKFRSGRIRVLTNYGVLTQGFDAPSTRVVVVARPVFSRNVYQQMIGRGLRGPKNGGKDTCLILNVSDNIANFDTQLAFTQFEHLWSRK